MRSSFALLFSAFGAALLFANCTVKSVDDTADESCTPKATHSCTCTNGDKGAQTCNSKGTGYSVCECDGSNTTESSGGSSNGTNNNEAGAGNEANGGASTAGTSQGGSTYEEGGAATIAEGGAGGEASDPFANIDPADCGACLAQLCPQQWQDCNDDPQCMSADTDGTGQYERIQNGCIEPARVDGLVKRDAVRGCGVSIGQSTDPQFLVDWAPEGMAASTTALMNCMAMGAKAPDASWANDEKNFPIDNDNVVQPVPWPAGTCAKLACTSQIQ